MTEKKTIFFDAAGTLFYISQGVGYHYSRIAAKHDVQVDPLRIDKRFHDEYAKSSHTVSEHAEKQWWYDLVGSVFEGIHFPRFDSFFEEVYSFFQQGDGKEERAWTLFPETMEVLEHLSALQHPIGLISNFDSRIEFILKDLNIFHYFKTITYSTEVGFAKPSVEIFQHALKKADCHPKDAVHIGDHLIFDVEGAQNAGIRAFLIDRDRKKQTGQNVIHDLREIYGNL